MRVQYVVMIYSYITQEFLQEISQKGGWEGEEGKKRNRVDV